MCFRCFRIVQNDGCLPQHADDEVAEEARVCETVESDGAIDSIDKVLGSDALAKASIQLYELLLM